MRDVDLCSAARKQFSRSLSAILHRIEVPLRSRARHATSISVVEPVVTVLREAH
jgi:hypothetical protein